MLTVMPSAIRSCAAVFVQAHSAVLAVLESARRGFGCFTNEEPMNTIRPQPVRLMCGVAARASLIEESALSLNALRRASSVASIAPAGWGPAPLPTAMSTEPNRSTAASTSEPGVAGSVKSALIARTSPLS